MTSVKAGHILLTPTQPVGSGLPQRGSNPGPLHQESRALPTELPRLSEKKDARKVKRNIEEGSIENATNMRRQVVMG